MATNKDIVKEMALMEQRMDSMDEKLDKMDGKLDMLTEKLLDPDDGVVARINKNTSFRKTARIWLGVFFTSIIGIVTKMLFDK